MLVSDGAFHAHSSLKNRITRRKKNARLTVHGVVVGGNTREFKRYVIHCIILMSGDIWPHLMDIGRNTSKALKRSALIMALTIWETYVEDRFRELVDSTLMGVKGSPVYQYTDGKVNNDLRYFHTPNSRNIKKLFLPLLGHDITTEWSWENFDSKRACEKLNEYIKLRGDVVHRAVTDKQSGHPVKKDELQKCIRFLNSLTNAMDSHLKLV